MWPEDEGEADVALAAAQGKPSVVVHKVAPGESLASIAEKYGVSPVDIKSSNNLRRNAVRVGQQLRITTTMPGYENTSVASTASRASSASKTKGSKSSAKSTPATTKAAAKKATPSYKIKNGESLSTISKRYGVSVAEIKKANGMSSDNLRAGKTLTIPAKKSAVKKSGSKKSGSKKSTSKKKRSKKRK